MFPKKDVGMRKKRLVATWLALVVLPSVPAFAQLPASASELPIVNLGFKADVLADGTLSNIEPAASLSPALQAMVRKRVVEWRYAVGSWQGKPAPMPISQKIVAEAVSVASGGFMLRIKQVEATAMPASDKDAEFDSHRMQPPGYPLEARRFGVSGAFIYVMRADAQGKPYDVELVAPERMDRQMRTLDESARAAVANWILDTNRPDGVPQDCRVVIPIEFVLGRSARSKPDLAPYRARIADACPAIPELITDVAGTVL